MNMKGMGEQYLTVQEAMIGFIRRIYPTLETPRNDSEIVNLYQSCFAKCSVLLIENAGSVEQIAALLPREASPSFPLTFVLVTSRKDLGLDVFLPNTLSLRLPALAPSDSLKLLRALNPSISMSAAQQIAELCGHLPLAIKIASSLMRRHTNLSPANLIARLNADNMQFAALWEKEMGFDGEEMYPEDIKVYMYTLCLFPGGFDGPAAATLLNKSYEAAEDVLGQLLEYSLLDFTVTTGRYHMNDLVRAYCRSKLAQFDARKSFSKELSTPTQQRDTLVSIKQRFITLFMRRLQDVGVLSRLCPDRAVPWFERERRNYMKALEYTRDLHMYSEAWTFLIHLAVFSKDRLLARTSHACPADEENESDNDDTNGDDDVDHDDVDHDDEPEDGDAD
eukprot:TRINITY_DN4374_c0_g1_i1.p1 TRINITY_DN4374_c0_g1~~TRINITY_DN4374_c0_g1_i1.p1  ORF type:complete len:393 (+),score=63.37 TRINITY_DN4374_c0_g1_i1:1621-2799(+)